MIFESKDPLKSGEHDSYIPDQAPEPGPLRDLPPPEVHVVKHSDCAYTTQEGPAPEAEETRVWREAHTRMKGNFERALNTIRILEDELRAAGQGFPVARMPESFFAWARPVLRALEDSGWKDHQYVEAGLTLGQLRELLR